MKSECWVFGVTEKRKMGEKRGRQKSEGGGYLESEERKRKCVSYSHMALFHSETSYTVSSYERSFLLPTALA